MSERLTWAGRVQARSLSARTWAMVTAIALLSTLLGTLLPAPAFAAGTINVSTTAYVPATPALGNPVTYVGRTNVSGTGNVTSKITVTQTTPVGVLPLAAFAVGFVCGQPSGRSISCTTVNSSFTNGSSSPDFTIVAIVNGSITASAIRTGSTTTATATGSTSGSDTSMGTGTLPTAPASVNTSPNSGSTAGGNTVTVTGTNITSATAVEIGTTAEMQAGTPVTLLDCGTSGTTNCFDVSGSNLIVYMPARSTAAAVRLTVVTRGVSDADGYTYIAPVPATPDAPTATAGRTRATVSWVAPANNGSAITGYTVTPYLGGVAQTAVSYASTATTQTLTGLTAGGSYTFTVAATSANGTSPASGQSNAVTPYAVPSAPTIGTATAGDSAVTLTWTAPNSTNGSAVTGYVVTPYIGTTAQTTQTFNSTATTQNVTGLTPGTAYTFTVAATNAAGTGPASASSASATPNASPTLTFAAPPDGRVGTAYSNQLAVTGGTSPFVWSVSTGSLPAGLTLDGSTGLLSGTPTTAGSYTATIKVVDASAQSATKSVTITITGPPATPAAPILTVSGTTATATWVAPAANGSPITGYSIRVYKDGILQATVAAGTATTFTSSGLTAGSVYTVTVAATNALGTSPYSDTSNTVVAYSVPGAPTGLTTTAGDSQVTVAWTAPSANGSAITGYVVTPYIGTTAQPTQTFNSNATTQTITGLTPGTAYTFTVAAVNAAGTGTASARSAAATPNASPSLNFPAPPDGRIGVAYSNQLVVTGGTSPFTWSVSAGSLPAGLTLDGSTGLLSGTPTALGTFTATVKVVDANSQSATQSVTITISDRPATPAAPTATAGISSATVTWVAPASNNSPLTGYVVTPYLGGTAQTPVTYDASATTRTVTGLTPGGIYTFTVAAVNASGTSNPSAQSAAVVPYAVSDAPSIGTATAGDSLVTLTWTAPTTTNGSAVTGYVVTPYIGATAQPTQTFNSTATTQTITGLTPGTAYTFTVSAVNAAGIGTASARSAAATPNASPTLNFPAPPDGRVGVAYSNQLVVTGGTAPFTWSVSTGTLPAGLTLGSTTGLLSGTPTTVGSSTFTVQVVDASRQSATQSVTLVVINKPAAPATPTATSGVSSATLTWVAPANNGGTLTGYVVTPYSNGVAQTSVTYDASTTTRTLTGLTAGASYTFTVAAVNAAGSGAASGQSAAVVPYAVPSAPTIGTVTAGDSQVTVTWTAPTNVNGSAVTGYVVTPYVGTTAQTPVTFNGTATTQTITGLSPTNAYMFTVAAVNAAGTGPASERSAPVMPNASPTLVFADPPSGEVGVAYSNQLTVTGGTAPFSWSVSSGVVPGGLSLGAGTGLLSGTPTTAGSSTFTVRIVDANAQSATRSVTLVIAAQPALAYAPSPGEVGVAFSQQPTLSGGTGPFAWRVSAGSLPAGVTIDASTGLLSGTPTASGTFNLTIAVTDSFNQVASRTVAIVIAPLPTLTFNAPPAGQVGVAYTTTLTASGGTAPLVWSIPAGSLPPGLTLNTANGVLSGTPTTVGTTAFTVAVTDANSKTATKAVSLVVAAGPVVITKTANTSSVAPGGQVTYTITATNTGTSTFSGVTISDPLTGVLDDSAYNADATASAGTLTYASPTLSWTGNLAGGAATTISYSVTVGNPVTGNQVLSNTVSSSTLGTNCAGGSADTRCTSTVTVSGLKIAKTASVATTTPGSKVTFTVVVTNTGQTSYAGATFTDSLTDVVDDATYNADGTATSGGVSYANSALTWTGDLAVGASASITYSATVTNPDPGNKILTGTVVSPSAGSTCPSGNPAASCTASVTVLVPALVISNTTNVSTITPGGRVPYTITFANTGQTAYTGTTVSIALAAALDDATYDNNFVLSSGSYTFNAATSSFVWTGNIAVGQVVTITGSVTVRDPDPGNKSVVTVASSSAAGSTCRAGSTNTACTTSVQVLVPQLTISKAADGATTTPGSVVQYTVTASNTGQTAYSGAAFTDALSGVLDDATYNNNAVATSGAVAFSSPNLTWTGDLAIGATATVTYSVTVLRPDPGNLTLTSAVTSTTAGNTCPAGSSDARCSNSVTVLIPGLAVSSVASVSSTTPGGVVRYNLSVANTGQTTYTNTTVLFDPRQVFDDASYNSDAMSSSGTFAPQANGTVLWTVTLAPGESATGTMSVTVSNPDNGDRSLITTVSSDAAGSTCPTGSAAAACRTSVPVLIPGLTITKTSDVASVTTGGVIRYSVAVLNSGETAYPNASFTDSLSDVLNDATYPGDAAATAGTVTYGASTLSWSGTLAPGETATITYSVNVLDPDPGDKRIINTVVSNAAGSNCTSTSSDSRCTANVEVLVPNLTLTKTSSVPTTVRDGLVSFTVKATNSGTTAYVGATFTEDLAGVLDDAVYNADAAASSGAVGVSGSTLRWTGNLAVGASASITYSVRVNHEDIGDDLLTNTVTSTTRGSNCPAGSTDARCSFTVPVARLIITEVYDEATAVPGQVLHAHGSFVNTGKVPYTDIIVSLPGDDVKDDVLANGDQTVSAGTLVLTPTSFYWTGSIGIGETITGAGTVTVQDPDPGNRIITSTAVSTAPGNNCLPGTTDPRCTPVVPVLIPQLSISKVANATTTVSGQTVAYTITINNSGQTAYTGATVTDNQAGLLDDASYNGDAVSTVGVLTYAAPTLSWTGDLAVGQSATISYSVKVNTPETGDKTMINTVRSDASGSTCPAGSGNDACQSRVVVLTPQLSITKTADLTNATLGTTVTYKIVVSNTGQVSYPAAAVIDSLSAVLDDATFNPGSLSASRGTPSYTGGVVSWSGTLAVGASATITYNVTINTTASGDRAMTNTASSTNVGGDCAPGSTDSRCTTVVAITNSVSLTFNKTANVATTSAGSVVRYTVSVINSSAAAIADANFTDPLGNILDDATYNGDAAATGGTVTFATPDLTWTGSIAAEETITITYSVTVKTAIAGNQILSGTVTSTSLPASNNCVAGSTDPRCTSSVVVARLLIQQGYRETTTTPGSQIHLQATFTNTGAAPYNGITISSPTGDTVDDANPNGDQTASSGTLVLNSTAIVWTGNIPVGATITVTGTLTVIDPSVGDRRIMGTLVTNAPGSNCPAGGTDTRCTAMSRVLIPGMTITKKGNTPYMVPGSSTQYTITIKNTGETPYAGTSITDDLAGLLDDATYNNDAVSDLGTLSYTSPNLVWTSDLAVGATATITYSATALTTSRGDKTTVNAVTSTATGTNCRPASGDPACRTTGIILTPALTITSAASPATTVPGATVSFTVVARNTGQTYYPAADFSIPLGGLLDDTSAPVNASTTAGSVVRNGSTLSWTGGLAPGAAATITYSVVVSNPDLGDHRLDQTVSSTTQGSTCPAGGVDPRCATSVPVASLLITNTTDAVAPQPTSVVRNSVTLTNTGRVPYVGATIRFYLAGVLDDAGYNGDASSTDGNVTLDPATVQLRWTGDLAVGASVTISGSATVYSPDPGDRVLNTLVDSDAPGNNCPAGSADPACRTSVRVLTPGLTVSNAPSSATVEPGGTVGYTLTVRNSGETTYTAARVTNALTGLLDDADYNNDAVATGGTVTFTQPALTWIGNLAVGQTVVITYSVTVHIPDFGDQAMADQLSSNELGSSCPSGGSGSACSSLVTVLTPGIFLSVVADRATTTPGATVGYTVRISNTGQTNAPGASVAILLGGALDDATYDGNAAADLGQVSPSGSNLTWTGDLALGATATVIYSVTVSNPDVGDRTLTTTLDSQIPGNPCSSGTGGPGGPRSPGGVDEEALPQDASCTSTVTVLIPGLAVSTTANVATTTPGSSVQFTLTIANNGQTAYSGAVVSTSLANVVDDATFTTVTSTTGTASYSAPNLTWTGNLAVGASATVTYTVLVRTPDSGNKLMSATAVSNAAGSTCPAGSTNASCTASVTVLIPHLTLTQSASSATTTPGGVVRYTNTVVNDGETAYTTARVTDSLADVLADANYNADATVVGGGVLSYAAPTLTWNGALPVGASARITYSVTVRNPDTGDKSMSNRVTSTAAGSTCPAAGAAAACSTVVQVLVPALSVNKTADTTRVVAGSPVRYSITLTNTGETAYAPATFTDALTGVLDDATYAGDAVATSGSLQYTNDTLAWSGPLAVGASASITYSVTTRFPADGDRTLSNTVLSSSTGSSCASGTPAACTSSVTVAVPELSLSKTADTDEVVAGGTVTYTILATNTGEADYPVAALSDPLTEVLDEGVYNGDATSSSGTVGYADETLTWTGALTRGSTTVIRFSITTDPLLTGDASLDNRVVSTTVGSTCLPLSTNPSCDAETEVEAGTLTLTGLTPSFTLTGLPGTTVTQEDAVSMTVTTNNPGGFVVTVNATDDALRPAPGNLDTIPINLVGVRGSSGGDFAPLTIQPVVVGADTTATGPGGDSVSTDYRIQIPDVVSDTYSGTLEYVATAR